MMPPQAVVDLLLGPRERLQRLHPLEVGDGHAAGVGQDVRQDEHPAVEQNLVRFRCRRAVGGFGNDAGLNLGGVAGRDLVLHRGRDQNLARQREQLGVVDRIRVLEPDDAPGPPLKAATATRSRPTGLWIPPRESLTATTGEPSSAISRAATAPALPNPWTTVRLPARSNPLGPCRLLDGVDAAPAGGLAPPLGTAETSGLPVTTPGAEYPTFIE
jgi:hypothetical protein